MTEAGEILHVHHASRVAYFTLNRPEKRNALNAALVSALKKAFQEAADDDAIRCIVLRAHGKVFSAGADLATLQQLQQNTYEENLEDSRHLKALFELMYHHPKPIIAQVEGQAIAGGCGLATVCDFIFATPEARFGYTEVRIGFVPAMVMIFLVRKIGEAAARRLLLSGELISSAEAVRLGMITEVVGQYRIEDYVRQFAGRLSRKASGEALARTRKMLVEIAHMPLTDALEYAAQQNAHARATEDCQKGIQGFLDKKPARW